MYRIKDFYLKNVYNIKGKKIGSTRDVFIDFSRGQVVGIKVSSYHLINKKNYLDINNIISFNEDIKANELEVKDGLKFSEIKDLEVVDKTGNIKGELEDMLIDEITYKIKALIVSGGIIDKIVRGKEVILISQSILKKEYILYLGEEELVVKNLPREANLNDFYKKV